MLGTRVLDQDLDLGGRHVFNPQAPSSSTDLVRLQDIATLAPAIDAYYVVTKGTNAPVNATNLGAMGNGFVKSTVAGATSTLSIDTNTYLTTTAAASTYQPILTSASGANLTSKLVLGGTADGGAPNAQFLGALPTGLLKNTTTTGVLSGAVSNTDFAAPGAFYVVTASTNAPSNAINLGGLTAGVLQQTVSGAVSTVQAFSVATGRIPYGAAGTSILKTDSSFRVVESGSVFRSLALGNLTTPNTMLTVSDPTGANTTSFPTFLLSTFANASTGAGPTMRWSNDLGTSAPFVHMYLTSSAGTPASTFFIEAGATSGIVPTDIYFSRNDFGGFSGGQFNTAVVKNDGAIFWFNRTAAVSPAGTAGIRANGNKLQYSENTGAWANFTDLSGAASGAFYVVTRSTSAPTNATNLGGMGTGLVKSTVSGGISTLSIDATAYLSGSVGPGAGAIGGAGSAIQSITLDVNGRVTAATAATLYYQTIAAAGTARTQRPALNFTSAFTAVDNAGATRTDVDLAATGVGAVSVTNANLTIGADGRIYVASNGSSGGTGADALGFYVVLQSSHAPANATNLGGAGSGFVKSSVSGGVSTLSIDASTYLTSAFYQTVASSGSARTQRATLNFAAAQLTATDNGGAGRTDIDLAASGVAVGTYAHPTLTVDTYGRVVSISAGTAADALGYYLVGRSTNAPTNAINLGGLGSGFVKSTVSGGVSTISIDSTTYQPALSLTAGSVLVSSGGSGVTQDNANFNYSTSTHKLTVGGFLEIDGTSGAGSIGEALIFGRAGDQAITKTGGVLYLATNDAHSIAFVTNGSSRGSFDSTGVFSVTGRIEAGTFTGASSGAVNIGGSGIVQSNGGGSVLTLQNAASVSTAVSLGPSGVIDVIGTVTPDAHNTYDLGSASKYWGTLYAITISMNTMSGPGGYIQLFDPIYVENVMVSSFGSMNVHGGKGMLVLGCSADQVAPSSGPAVFGAFIYSDPGDHKLYAYTPAGRTLLAN